MLEAGVVPEYLKSIGVALPDVPDKRAWLRTAKVRIKLLELERPY
jgi:hypothetical protein